MKPLVLVIIGCLALSACRVTLPTKGSIGSAWHLTPKVALVNQKKDFSVVVAKPWIAPGYEGSKVLVSLPSGERDVLAGVVWSAGHGEWVRNYFVEGLQSSSAFSAVSGNLKHRDSVRVVQLYLWDLSVHYQSAARLQPTVKAKMAVTITNEKGKKLLDQQIIAASYQVKDNRVDPIMAGFDVVIDDCFKKIYQLLIDL